jgi:hypothetical protein
VHDNLNDSQLPHPDGVFAFRMESAMHPTLYPRLPRFRRNIISARLIRRPLMHLERLGEL